MSPLGEEFRSSTMGQNIPGDPEFWERVAGLFEKLLEAESPEQLLAEEPEQDVAAAARKLWADHEKAERNNFLGAPAIDLTQAAARTQPVFGEGQLLAGRFRIARMLGHGGMGEVYLAQDEKLQVEVAVKTILAELAASAVFRGQLLTEVRSARVVTHPNVCRIFEVFDEDGVLFYTMEYLPGQPLTEWLDAEGADEGRRRRVALELAEGLSAAHEKDIVHRDFKPANVIVRPDGTAVITDFGLARPQLGEPGQAQRSLGAGTVRYMAPELRRGERASVASDIYAYGAVLEELLPGHPVAATCLSEQPGQRPRTMRDVVSRLRGPATSRRMLMGVAAGAATAAGAGAWYLGRSQFRLYSQQRAIVNGIRTTVDGATPLAIRELLLLALRQSPLLRIVPDVRVRALLRQSRRSGELPASLADLFAVASVDRIPLVLETSAQEIATGIRLAVHLFTTGEEKPVLTVTGETAGPGRLVELVAGAAAELRRQLGESAAAMKSNLPLEQITSNVPEAVQLYYRAVQAQDKNDGDAALAYLDEAIRMDPDFAIAHQYRGVTLITKSRFNDAMPSLDRAFALRMRLQERERNLIEAQRYLVLGDPERSLAASKRNAVLYPDEPSYQRLTASAHARLGQFSESLGYCRRALELDPFNDNNLSELIVTLAEAKQPEEALRLYQEFRKQGNTSTLLDWGAGQARLVMGQYGEAAAAFARMGSASVRSRWAALLETIPQILQGDWAGASQRLANDLAHDDATNEQNRRHTRRLWLAELALLRDDRRQAQSYMEALLALLEPTAKSLEFIHQGGILAARSGTEGLAKQYLEALQKVDQQCGSTQSQGCVAHLVGVMGGDRGQLGRAKGLWPHPPVLLSCGEAELAAGDLPEANRTFEKLEALRGKTFKHYFPGIAVMGWRLQAKTLSAMSQKEEAFRLYQRVAEHWGTSGASGAWQREFLQEWTGIRNLMRGKPR